MKCTRKIWISRLDGDVVLCRQLEMQECSQWLIFSAYLVQTGMVHEFDDFVDNDIY